MRAMGPGMHLGCTLKGATGGLNLGPIWPWLASFTPSGEAGNEAAVASFGPPLTRTRRASRPWLASLRVARSGKLLNLFRFVPFRSISLSSTRAPLCPGRVAIPCFSGKCSFWSFSVVTPPLARTVFQEWSGVGDPHALARYGPIWPDLLLAPSTSPSPRGEGTCRGQGCEVPAFAGPTDYLRVNDACNQCKGWRGDGAMGSCRRLGVCLWPRDVKAVRGPPLHPNRGQGCAVPVFTGTTGHNPMLRLRIHPHPSLLPSREKGPEPAWERRGFKL